MSTPPLRFEAEDGAFAVELDGEALGAIAGGGAAESPWTVLQAPDWTRVDSLRLLAARFGEGSLAALVALRPAGAAGHDADAVTAVLADPTGAAESVGEALLSIELDGERRVRRVGVELWTSEDQPPRRLAADRTATAASSRNGVASEASVMDARLDGERGTAVFEVVRPG